MRVTLISLQPTQSAQTLKRPSLTPELLAAVGARFSRNNEGLEAIRSRIDPDQPDKSVDSIFKMVDYGHQSIADMVPVAMALEGISLWLAYLVWSVCPTRMDLPLQGSPMDGEDEFVAGQESSTRYIRFTVDELLDSGMAALSEEERPAWQTAMGQSLEHYRQALAWWQKQAVEQPAVMRIPQDLLNDPSEKAKRKVDRMRRNYAFDRARYFIPLATRTNVMLILPARAWVQLCQHLLSHDVLGLPEPAQLGQQIRSELDLAAPRMLRHAVAQDSSRRGLQQEWNDWAETAGAAMEGDTHGAEPFLEVHPPPDHPPAWKPGAKRMGERFAGDLANHDNRYAMMGPWLRNTSVRFGWSAVSFAEIRDLNRHRTGSKHCPLLPLGFYGAQEQAVGAAGFLRQSVRFGADLCRQARRRLARQDWRYLYWLPLGVQFPFQHVTTAEKFIYEAELRTGAGAHFQYAKHLRDVLALWYRWYPETKGLILEGSAEPE
jgi:hypothetical protein